MVDTIHPVTRFGHYISMRAASPSKMPVFGLCNQSACTLIGYMDLPAELDAKGAHRLTERYDLKLQSTEGKDEIWGGETSIALLLHSFFLVAQVVLRLLLIRHVRGAARGDQGQQIPLGRVHLRCRVQTQA